VGLTQPSVAAVDLAAVAAVPQRGQSADQTRRDRYECHNWAVEETGTAPRRFEPDEDSDHDRAERVDDQYKEALKDYAAEQKRVLGEKMSTEALKNFDAVVFANTTGDLPLPDPQAFVDWVKAGHGFVGMHSATDTFHGFRPYIEMIGGEFQTHGAQATVDCLNQDTKHAACKHLPATWTVHDEIYLLKSFNAADVRQLLLLDKEPNKKTPGEFPISWCKQFGKGRVFYTSLGHREDIWDEHWGGKDRKNSTEVSKAYQQHILSGIQWALGDAKGSAKPQKK
jgi:type 1 glutamine amidotransferase